MARLDRLLNKAKTHFDQGEHTLQAVAGAYEGKLMGKDAVRSGIFIATDQRLLFYAKKFTGYFSESFPYPNISSIEMGKNLLGHYITFFASGNHVTMKWIAEGDVRAFVDAVKTRMANAEPMPCPTPVLSPASRPEQPTDLIDQLERLGQLHAAGTLTDEEFSAKKADILKRL